MNKTKVTLFWFRRDLRLEDNVGLFHALQQESPVLPFYIYDPLLLAQFENKQHPQITFIHQELEKLQAQLIKLGSSLIVKQGSPLSIIKQFAADFEISGLHTNSEYEAYPSARDHEIASFLKTEQIPFHSYKDHVIFEKEEILTPRKTRYLVFTPYSTAWKATLKESDLTPFCTSSHFQYFCKLQPTTLISLTQLGFEESKIAIPSRNIDQNLMLGYANKRDFPALHGTSRLGVHLRFGTISIRSLVSIAKELSNPFLNELIWREFYQSIAANYPLVQKGWCFKPIYDQIKWVNSVTQFELWCNGMTGYPLVDAGMRELNATGFMHNRVRMVVASFLVKHLLIDWRWGEAYFAGKLLDYDFAANNGGWQWAAGSGCDAVPYFRIFNPTLQAQRFDPQNEYIRKWIPELETPNYPQPMVDHKQAREKTLSTFKKALANPV